MSFIALLTSPHKVSGLKPCKLSYSSAEVWHGPRWAKIHRLHSCLQTLGKILFCLSQLPENESVWQKSHVCLFGTPWIIACQVPLSVGFPRQQYCSGKYCISFSRGYSWPRDSTWVSCIADSFFAVRATGEARQLLEAAHIPWFGYWPLSPCSKPVMSRFSQTPVLLSPLSLCSQPGKVLCF